MGTFRNGESTVGLEGELYRLEEKRVFVLNSGFVEEES